MTGARDEPAAPRNLGALDEDNLFATGLVASNPAGRRRRKGVLSALFAGTFVVEALLLVLALLLPILLPSELPDQGDRRVVFFDPPPPPPPPLPKGSPLQQQQAKPEAPKPVTETKPKPELTAPIETPQPQQTAQLQPDAGVSPEDQFGSATGSDFGDPLGMEEGVEGGVVGGVPGGVLGGVLGGTGTGYVMDYDSAPRPIKITRPQYPQEAFVKKVEGTVVVEILIDSQGRVVRARVIQSVPLLDAAALQTVYQWIFQPAVKHGRPVPTIAH
ncbi:MAG TPA: TonB family protein, partial [Vicinamibacteria bacterium]|nr:TonB family protein [Vicinamibacteria bacterium]